MNAEEFTQQLESVYERADALYKRTEESHHMCQQPELLVDSIEELRTALEELHVAEEQLRQQNQELRATRQMVEAERQRYRELFEFAPDGYLVTDIEATIREANRAAAKLLNVSQNFLVGKPLLIFIPEEERHSFRSQINRLRQGDELQEWDVQLKPRDLTPFDAALTVACVRDWQGKPVALRWMLRDITARKQAEEKIRQIQLQNLELIETTKLKSQFMAIMSHELRTPMNAIIGFSQLLLRHPQHRLAHAQASMVERIFNSGKNLLNLIEDILDFSKLEAGRFELKPEEFNLAELVTATVEELRSLAQQKHLELHVNCVLDNPCVVNDSSRLRQILVNLLSNAIKFTESGSVWVEVWELAPDRVAIALRDTGIGIASSDLPHIFQEFRQVNQTMTRQYGGTGLGLAITNSLVHLMKGKITVDSKLGEGSTFQVALPRCVSGEKS